MDKTLFTQFDQLPLVLGANEVSKALNISRTSAYALLHRRDFPTLMVGKRMLVPRDRFLKWIEDNTQ